MTGVGTPCRRPSSTISPARWSTSVPPAPRVMLCQVEPPRGGWPVGRGCRSRRGAPRPASAVTTGTPAASEHRLALGRRALVQLVGGLVRGAQVASTALPRFISSLRCFQAMMSGRGTDSNPAARRSAATDSVSSSVPRRDPARCRGCPARGGTSGRPRPGSRWVAGSITSDRRRSARTGAARPLVGDPVLGAHHRHVRRARARPGRRGRPRCAATSPRAATTVSSVHVDLGRGVRGRRVRRRTSPRGCRGPARAPGSRARCVAAGDERDVVAGAVQVAADHPADGAGAVDDVPHELAQSWIGLFADARPGPARRRPTAAGPAPIDAEHRLVEHEPDDDQADAGEQVAGGHARNSVVGCRGCRGTASGRSWRDHRTGGCQTAAWIGTCWWWGSRWSTSWRRRAARRTSTPAAAPPTWRSPCPGWGARCGWRPATPPTAHGEHGRRPTSSRRAWRWRPTRARWSARRPRWRRSAPTGGARYTFDLDWRLNPVPGRAGPAGRAHLLAGRGAAPRAPTTCSPCSAGCGSRATVTYDVNARPAVTGTGSGRGRAGRADGRGRRPGQGAATRTSRRSTRTRLDDRVGGRAAGPRTGRGGRDPRRATARSGWTARARSRSRRGR